MPGWHAATREFEADGRLLNVGLIQEQHPDRARLYLQWQGIEWPIMIDSLNRLDVNAVPITLLIDENGVIRQRVGRGDIREIVEEFLAEPAPEPLARNEAASGRDPAVWGDLEQRDAVIEALEERLAADRGDGRAAFELGVHYRRRYDESESDPLDFERAVERWGQALAIDPNQYIWRRRIQQYGPRLEKPYPFYDWVPTARERIRARGEIAAELIVEPGGAEIARPIRSFDAALPEQGEPDPGGKTLRDDGKFVVAHATVVPHRVRPGKSARVHVEFRPRGGKAHWNNEAGGMTLWIDPPAGWQVDPQRIERPNPPEQVSDEPRRVEFEIQAPEGAATIELPVYALYYVCEGDRGACLYRRQDFGVPVTIAP